MKIREGFVSNSSSSSFIVASADPHSRTLEIAIKKDITDLCDGIFQSIEELDAYYEKERLEHQWSKFKLDTIQKYLEWNGETEQYEKMKNYLERGFTVFTGSVSNEDDNPVSYLIYQEGFPKQQGFKVIYNED